MESYKGSVLQQLSKIAIVVLSLLLVGAAIFYKQRMLFIDPAFVAFSIINQHHLLILEHRYGAFITQIVPLIGSFLHLSIKQILCAYSISFNAFYLIVALMLVYRFKQFGLAILLAFYFTLFVSATYFWTNNEVHQGIAWMFLCIGVTLYFGQQPYKKLAFIPLIVLAFLAIFSHFLVVIPFAFLWLYLWINKTDWPFSNPISCMLTALLALLFLLKLELGLHGWYDAGLLHNATHLSVADVLHAFTNDHAKQFSYRIATNYWPAIILFLLGIVSLIKHKKYVLALLSVAFCLAYFTAICITFSGFGRDSVFYMESEWMGLAIIASTPFVYNVLPLLKLNRAVLFLVLIFSIRFAYMLDAAPDFLNRLHFIASVHQKMHQKGFTKLIILRDDETKQALINDWGIPVESLLLSAMNKDMPQISFSVLAPDDLKKVPQNKYTFLSSFAAVNAKDLNQAYFHLDTTQNYKIMSYHDLMK
jgi:hypothetical protein